MMNQRVPSPYGDIFSVETPKIDQMGEMLYAEHRMQEQQKLANNRALDDEFSKNLSEIRDADIDDLTSIYNEWKTAYKNLEKMGERATPKEQMEVARKKGEIYKLINESQEYKKWLDSQGKQIATDKRGAYADNAHQQIIDRMKIPTRKSDRSKDADLLYPYTIPNIEGDIKNARGSKRKVEIKLGASKDDPLTDEVEVYEVGNTPIQYFNTLLQGVVSGNKGKNFSGYILNQYDDKSIQELKDKYYAKVNDPKFKQVYGETSPFPNHAFETPVGQAAMIKTMEEVVNQPLIGKVDRVVNKQRSAQDRQKFAKEQQQRAQTFSFNQLTRMINARQLPWMNATDMANFIIDRDNEEADATPDGVVKTDDAKYKTITGNDYSSSSQLRSDGKGGYIYGKVGADGKFIERGRVSAEEAKDRLIKAAPKNPVNVTPETRLPKDIKKTKTNWKDRAKKVN